MDIHFDQLSPNQVYYTLIQTIIPRPIAWILTENHTENYNLAPFSYFTAVASEPPLLMVSIGKKPNSENKDTLTNIEKTKHCVVHIADTSLAEQVNQSAAGLEYGESEVDYAGLSTTEFGDFGLPRITQAKIALACSLHEIKEIGNKPMNLVFLEVQQAYIDDDIIQMNDKHSTIDAIKLDPLARLGGNDYAAINKPFTIGRPK